MPRTALTFLLIASLCACGGDDAGPASDTSDTRTDTTLDASDGAESDTLSDTPDVATSDTASDTVDDTAADDDADTAADAAADTATDTADATPSGPAVTITSHADGAVVVGARAVTLAGAVSGDANIVAVSITQGGTAVAATFDQTGFSAALTLSDGDNRVVVTVSDANALSATAQVTLRYPFVTLSDFAPASLVLGQADFASDDVVSLDDTAFRYPLAGAPELDGMLFVADYGANRVLGFRGFPSADGAAADLVLGQLGFATNTSGHSATALDGPNAVATDGTRLYVADGDNARILIWNAAPTANGAPADLVVGQPDFDSTEPGCSPEALGTPSDVVAAGGRLIVADWDQHRVLVWSEAPTVSGTPPDLVLGQADFKHCADNDDDQDGVADAAPTARTLRWPISVWSDGTRLAVADQDNHRVLVWSTFPTSSFQPADVVIGQDGATTAIPGLGPTSLNYPTFLASNGNQLAVADVDNSRVLLWDTFPTANVAPDHVLGQSDLSHGAGNDDDQDGSADDDPSARTMREPWGVAFVRDALLVADTGNRRLLAFGPLPCPVNAGLVELPAGSGVCITDPCPTVTCDELETCRANQETGAAECVCQAAVATDCGSCVRRVNPDAAGSGTGLSWADGMTTVQSAIEAAYAAVQALPGGTCEVWIEGGTHYTYQASASDTVQLRPGVTLRGGFAGTEASAEERTGAAETILDGAEGPAGASRVYHVLTATGATTLDRLTVRGGAATGSGADANGGGLRATAAVSLVGCRFEDNLAVERGGAIWTNAALTVSGSTFTQNTAGLNGGAIDATAGGTVVDSTFTANACCTAGPSGGGAVRLRGVGTVAGSTFSGNVSADSAGALHASGSPATITVSANTFVANRAALGGAVYYDAAGGLVESSLFVGNTATGNGGAMHLRDGSPAITSSTFVGNVAGADQGAVSFGGTSSVLTNLVVWQNVAANAQSLGGNATVAVSYSDVQGGWSGAGNLDVDPGFVRAPIFWDLVTVAATTADVVTVGGHGGTLAVGDTVVLGEDGVAREVTAVAGSDVTFAPALSAPALAGTVVAAWGPGVSDVAWDLRLGAGSPCIDAGDGDAAAASDLEGHGPTDDPAVVDTGTGTPTYTDLGCYER